MSEPSIIPPCGVNTWRGGGVPAIGHMFETALLTVRTRRVAKRLARPTIYALWKECALPHRPHRCGNLLRPVALIHVDDGFHRRGEFVDVTHFGEIALRGAAHRFRRYAVEQDEAEITVFPPRGRAGVELLPAKMKDRIRLLARDFPVGDDVRVLADQRQALVGMRRQFEEH